MRVTLLALCVLPGLIATSVAAEPDQVEALEVRVRGLEADIAALRQQPASAVAAPSPGAAASGASGNLFNPALSIILNGQYAYHSLDPGNYVRSGFPLTGEAGPGAQGLSLGESEIALSANIDDKFYGQLIVAVGSEDGEDELGIEEAYIDTSALPRGLTLRAGRFLSNIGYLNNHHAHTDTFADRPLAYQAFLGNQYGDDGVQLRWVAPTDLFLELGGELLRGQGFPSGGAAHRGVGVYTVFAHTGGDVGIEHSWLAGLSVLNSRTVAGEDGFTGNGKLHLADLTWKWAPQGNIRDGGITVRSEYFFDDRDGEYMDPAGLLPNQSWRGNRQGVYVEGIYRLSRQWETGYRYDRLWADKNGPYASDVDPDRHSVMLTWHNSEFSLVRLQLGHDKPDSTDTDNVVILQYQMALGAHGAHKF